MRAVPLLLRQQARSALGLHKCVYRVQRVLNMNPTTVEKCVESCSNVWSVLTRHVQILSFMLHRDYLVTQSTLFQKLLDPNYTPDGTVPPQTEPTKIPLTAPSTYSSFSDKGRSELPPGSGAPSANPAQPKASPVRINGAKILTTTTGVVTTIWLPLPDPNSFQVLAHWLYW